MSLFRDLLSKFNSSAKQEVASSSQFDIHDSNLIISATIMNYDPRIKDYMNILIDQYRNAETETIINSTTRSEDVAYKINGSSDFLDKVSDFMIAEGFASKDDFKNDDLSNPASTTRLRIYFTTKIAQKSEFKEWKQRISNEGYLNQYPAAEFLRTPGNEYSPALHLANVGQIRRWDDFDFWLKMNSAEIGGFEVPWGPWGIASNMYQSPVSRSRAEELGIVKKGEIIKSPDVSSFGISLTRNKYDFVIEEEEDICPKEADRMRDEIRKVLGKDAIGPDGRPTLEAYRRALGRK